MLVCTLTAYAGLHIDLHFCTVTVYAGLHRYCVCWFALLLYRLTSLDAETDIERTNNNFIQLLYMKVIMNQMGYLLAGVSRTKPIRQKETRGVHTLGQQSWATRLFNNLEECRTILGNNLGQQSWPASLGNCLFVFMGLLSFNC